MAFSKKNDLNTDLSKYTATVVFFYHPDSKLADSEFECRNKVNTP